VRRNHWLIPILTVILTAGSLAPLASKAQDLPPVAAAEMFGSSLHALAPVLARLAADMPGVAAISIGDLRTGHAIDINGGVNLPAASTIKIPVMVEVFRQVAIGKFSLRRTVTLYDRDRDCGYGALCDAAWGSEYRVGDLLVAMIDKSDNTATNMLIRLVGRQHINSTMAKLGLTQTRLGDSIRSDGDIRVLRTSADDMLRLLTMIAAGRVVDSESCESMMTILAGQRHNSLLPALLPKNVIIAHKTGTLHDTLNDVGIVELDGAPYVICIFTTHLADLDTGQDFIRQASLMTFESFARVEKANRLSNARL
jgi:beta-lactamase class A